ncbi:hypothetical protein TWF217_004905 [Orbilia oligospora]|nr:hypothetical protein TWF217_004905 [Orbilia oligospora]KAF3291698.1 hypothetical protein TWF132_006680 [Orbilia oligospora]
MAPPTNHERNSSSSSKPKRKKSKRSKNDNDDTPKAFTRLMAYAATGKRPNGLDEPKTKPTSTSKKRKRLDPTSESNTVGTSTTVDTLPESEPSTTTAPEPSKPLTLLPGEKLSDFSRRVDAAIPVSFKGLQRGEDNPKNRKLKKKKAAEEAEAAAAEEITEDSYDFDDNGDPLPNHLKPHNHNPHTKQQVNKTTKGKRKDRSPSPFAVLREKRGAVQSSINDVVQAPPSLTVPKEKLRDKTKGGVRGIQGLEVPKASGSLARREMLQEERKGVVERYRALMAARSGGM